MKIKDIVAIELDQNTLKCALISNHEESHQIKAIGSMQLTSLSIEDQAEELLALLKELRIETTWSIFSLSRLHVTSRTLKLPSTDLSELQDMISFQTTKLVPFSKDEVILDYTVLETTSDGFSVVHVVLCPKEIVKKILMLASAAGLNVLSIRLNTQELATYTEHQFKNEDLSQTLFIEADTEATHFFVIHQEKLLFSRSVKLNYQELCQTDNKERVVRETQNTLTLLHKEQDQVQIKKLCFLNLPEESTSPLFESLKSALNLSVENKSMTPPYKKLASIESSLHLNEKELSFSALFGISKGLDKGILNFMPLALDQKIEKQVKQKVFFQFALLFTGLVLLTCGFLYAKNVYQDQILVKLSKKTAQTKTLASKLIKEEQKIVKIKQQQNPDNFVLSILSEVYRLIPKEISLDSLSYDQAKGVFLKGTAFTLSDAVNLIPKFEESNSFVTVISKGTTTKKIKNQVYTDFQLELPFPNQRVANE